MGCANLASKFSLIDHIAVHTVANEAPIQTLPGEREGTAERMSLRQVAINGIMPIRTETGAVKRKSLRKRKKRNETNMYDTQHRYPPFSGIKNAFDLTRVRAVPLCIVLVLRM